MKKTDDNGKKLDGKISDKYYLTCKKMWNKSDMKNMVDYHNRYLREDVLLLADIFEKFIGTCLKSDRLDPYHYFSSRGLNWDAMLKTIGVKLEKISGIDMTYSSNKN